MIIISQKWERCGYNFTNRGKTVRFFIFCQDSFHWIFFIAASYMESHGIELILNFEVICDSSTGFTVRLSISLHHAQVRSGWCEMMFRLLEFRTSTSSYSLKFQLICLLIVMPDRCLHLDASLQWCICVADETWRPWSIYSSMHEGFKHLNYIVQLSWNAQ